MGVGPAMYVMPHEAAGHDLMIADAQDTATNARPHPWIWCRKCGAHSQQRLASLSKQCRGQKNTAQLRNLNAARHPIRALALGSQPRKLEWGDISAKSIRDMLAFTGEVTNDQSSCTQEAEVAARDLVAQQQAQQGDISDDDPEAVGWVTAWGW